MTKGFGRVGVLAGVMLLWAGGVAAEPPSEAGLAAYWDFDEPSGARAVNRTGGDNHGTLRGTPAAQRVEGPFGSPSLRFTGPLQEVTGPDAGLPVGASPGSVSLWFRPDAGATDKVLFVYGSGVTGQARGLWLRDPGTLSFFFRNNPPDLHAAIPGGVAAGRWHHVAGTYDGTTARLYYDGKLRGEIQTKINTVLDGTFHIGANIDEHFRDFLGSIDDVAVYDRALTADEIRDHYALREEVLSRLETEEQAKNLARILESDVEEIVFAVRQPGKDGHWYANFGYWSFDPEGKLYGDGGRLCRLNLRTGGLEVLLDDPQGGVRDPQVHYDGRTILFSYRKGGQPYYHLYEIQADGSGLRQLTDGPYDDFEPTYLPDGDIIFCSSRCNRWVPCWSTLVANLHRSDSDGGNIRMISSNIEQENTPCVLPDGRILYTRWEYVDRSQVDFHHLWSFNPDGTGQMIYYGNMHPGVVMIDALPIPGTNKVVASFSPGHGRREHVGTINVVDATAGPDQKGFTRSISQGGDFRDPFPISADYFLVARGQSILLMDGQGVTTPLYTLPAEDAAAGLECHEPRMVQSRRRERLIPPRSDPAKQLGRLVLADVTYGRNMQGVEPGDVKKLLVLESLAKPVNFNMPGHPMFQISHMEPLTIGGSFCLARVLGTVPVEPDGSAHFELPAMRSLFFVALDENDLSVKRMQSFVTVQPGETTGCSGCHEQRTNTPPPTAGLLALKRSPSRIEPFPNIPDVLDFPRDVQPILDRHCVECHNPDRRDGEVDLSADHTPVYSSAYWTIVKHRLISDARNGYGNRPPRSIGSSASRLLDYIDGRHYEARLSPQERSTLILWIETGATYPGTYASYLSGITPVDFPVLQMTRRCGGCHGCEPNSHPRLAWEGVDIRPWARLPLKFGNADPALSLSNLTRPEKSYLLLAPLSPKAGGYGLCSQEIFADTDDPDYQTILRAITAAKTNLETIKRFDMSGFHPNEHYFRELKHFGILPASQT
ncbi:MAG: LamG-like jellyroll fold domain-containing protein, partial [Planctomycetota bacterium]